MKCQRHFLLPSVWFQNSLTPTEDPSLVPLKAAHWFSFRLTWDGCHYHTFGSLGPNLLNQNLARLAEHFVRLTSTSDNSDRQPSLETARSILTDTDNKESKHLQEL